MTKLPTSVYPNISTFGRLIHRRVHSMSWYPLTEERLDEIVERVYKSVNRSMIAKRVGKDRALDFIRGFVEGHSVGGYHYDDPTTMPR